MTRGGPKRPTHSISAIKEVFANGATATTPIPIDGIEPDDYLVSTQARNRTTGVILTIPDGDAEIDPAGGHIFFNATDTSGHDLLVKWFDRRQQSPVSVQYGDVAAGSLVLNPATPIEDVGSQLYAWWKPENIGLLAEGGSQYFDQLDDEMVNLTIEEFELIKRYGGWKAKSGVVTSQTALDALNLQVHVPAAGVPGNGTRGVNVNGYRVQTASLSTQGASGTDGSGLETIIPDDFAGAWALSIVVNPRDDGSGGLWSIGATSLTSDSPPILGEGLNTISSPFAPVANEPYIVTSILRTDASSKLLVNNLVPVVGDTGANTFTAPETLFFGNVIAPATPVDNTPDMDWIEIVLGQTGSNRTVEKVAFNTHDYLMRKYRFRGQVN